MMDKKLELKDIVLIGRTFEEYYKMFVLDKINLKAEKILDVASGVSSFCSEANSKGYNVTASDKIYHFSAKEIEEKCITDLKMVMEKLPLVSDLYKWKFFKDIDALKENRERAYKLWFFRNKVEVKKLSLIKFRNYNEIKGCIEFQPYLV
ncbi:MAG: hypothetical protein HY096_12015 [Nitrospinae bacterium]|nr:hypothetical protein [Nitrospinota bacterium]